MHHTRYRYVRMRVQGLTRMHGYELKRSSSLYACMTTSTCHKSYGTPTSHLSSFVTVHTPHLPNVQKLQVLEHLLEAL